VLVTRPTGGLLACSDTLSAAAADVADRYERVADGVRRRDRAALNEPLPDLPSADWPTDLGQDLYHLADLRVWLDGLRDDLGRITAPPQPAPSALRVRVARLADDATS
jgi:hypothetical protein